MIRLDDGETAELVEPLTTQTLQYIGSPGDADNSPDYNAVRPSGTVQFISQGDSLTEAIAKLDYALDMNVPLGVLFDFYDFNGALTFDTTRWCYANGQVKTFRDIGAQTTPDLSNRYCVGFGTEGGGDIGSAAWATAAVGNASHQVNLQHLHANTLSTYSGSSGNASADHTHTGGSHQHGVGTLQFQTAYTGALGPLYMFDSGGSISGITWIDGLTGGGGHGLATYAGEAYYYTRSGTGSVASGGAVSTGGQSNTHSHTINHTHTLTNVNAGSTTQSIQVRSVRTRKLIKYN